QYCFDEASVYVTWDDHEVGDDYLPNNPLAPIGRKAFLDYWPIRIRAVNRRGFTDQFAGAGAWSFSFSTRASIETGKKEQYWARRKKNGSSTASPNQPR